MCTDSNAEKKKHMCDACSPIDEKEKNTYTLQNSENSECISKHLLTHRRFFGKVFDVQISVLHCRYEPSLEFYVGRGYARGPKGEPSYLSYIKDENREDYIKISQKFIEIPDNV